MKLPTPLFTVLSLFLLMFLASAEEVPTKVQKQLEVLLAATKENDLEKFHSVCSSEMKKAITKKTLKDVSDQVSGLIMGAYTTSYLGTVDRLDYKTYLWKLTFEKTKSPDILVELSTTGDEVAGFFIK